MTERNTYPADHFEVLKRLLNCNWSQLAEHLEVTPKTLYTWRTGGAGKTGCMAAQQAMHRILLQANADYLLLDTNWAAVHSIGGKK